MADRSDKPVRPLRYRKETTKKPRLTEEERVAHVEYMREYNRRNAGRQKAWHDANKHKSHESNMKRYGITPDTYAEMVVTQDGKCAICRCPEPTGKRLSVDHCHESGKVRELLCGRCNRLLGKVRDDPSILDLAAAYLRKHK